MYTYASVWVCFSSKRSPLAGGYAWVSPMFSSYGSPGGDSRNDQSVVRDKVLVKSQAGNETIHPREPGHAEVEPGP